VEIVPGPHLNVKLRQDQGRANASKVEGTRRQDKLVTDQGRER
jgi:hypothetical protein